MKVKIVKEVMTCDILPVAMFLPNVDVTSYPELERSIRMGPVEFFSSLGGLFGLCLGFSIISFIEVSFLPTLDFFF